MQATFKSDRTKITDSEATKGLDGDQAALPTDKPEPYKLESPTYLVKIITTNVEETHSPAKDC